MSVDDFLTDFLAVVLHEEGAPNPRGLAEKAADQIRKAHLVNSDHLALLERQRRIYELRCLGMTVPSLAERFGISIPTVKRAIRHQIQVKRIA